MGFHVSPLLVQGNDAQGFLRAFGLSETGRDDTENVARFSIARRDNQGRGTIRHDSAHGLPIGHAQAAPSRRWSRL